MNCSFLLIGHRGSGKTTLGKQLAQARALPFIDLDEAISAREGRPAAELVIDDEHRFRRLEHDMLHELLSGGENAVIAVGGGCLFFPDGIRTIWMYREGWEETALRDRARLRPELSPAEEISWMKTTREEQYRRHAHLCLHIERDCPEEEAARRLIFLSGWLAEVTGSPALKKSWIVPRDKEDLSRAEADVRLFAMAGVELRSDMFPELPEPTVPWMASLRGDDADFFQCAREASVFDCDSSFLRCLNLKGLTPRPLILSSHPDDVYKEFFDFLISLPAWASSHAPDWAEGVMLKYAPRVKSWVELRYANQLYKVYERDGHRINFLPQGKNWKWMRIQRLFHGNDINYLSTGCLEHSHRPPTLDYLLPHAIGNHARDLYGVIGKPVEQSVGDIFHRALSLESDNGNATYLKIPVSPEEVDNCLHLLPQIGFRGLSVTAPLKSTILESNFVGTEHDIRSGNTLALVKGSFLLYDTDELGMLAALEAIEQDGVTPGSTILFGGGGVTASVTRALAARGWGPVHHIRARDGWTEQQSEDVRLIIDASGAEHIDHGNAPHCNAWLDLRYRNLPPSPPQAERFYGGMTFYKRQALAQRRIWGMTPCDTHPLL
ncbi:MAG: AAA family ATPase [Bacteroidetes bacterium]|nr:AAA family ATPase [Bacteroidota bacterium]